MEKSFKHANKLPPGGQTPTFLGAQTMPIGGSAGLCRPHSNSLPSALSQSVVCGRNLETGFCPNLMSKESTKLTASKDGSETHGWMTPVDSPVKFRPAAHPLTPGLANRYNSEPGEQHVRRGSTNPEGSGHKLRLLVKPPTTPSSLNVSTDNNWIQTSEAENMSADLLSLEASMQDSLDCSTFSAMPLGRGHTGPIRQFQITQTALQKAAAEAEFTPLQSPQELQATFGNLIAKLTSEHQLSWVKTVKESHCQKQLSEQPKLLKKLLFCGSKPKREMRNLDTSGDLFLSFLHTLTAGTAHDLHRSRMFVQGLTAAADLFFICTSSFPLPTASLHERSTEDQQIRNARAMRDFHTFRHFQSAAEFPDFKELTLLSLLTLSGFAIRNAQWLASLKRAFQNDEIAMLTRLIKFSQTLFPLLCQKLPKEFKIDAQSAFKSYCSAFETTWWLYVSACAKRGHGAFEADLSQAQIESAIRRRSEVKSVFSESMKADILRKI